MVLKLRKNSGTGLFSKYYEEEASKSKYLVVDT